jgi:hypothetical protein
MKQVALAFLMVFGAAPALWAGPEPISGKDMKQAVEPLAAVDWYADNEWNVSIWGTYVFSANGTEKEDVPPMVCWEPDRYLGADDAWGGGLDIKYFFRRYFGVGIEGYALAVHRDAPDFGTISIGEKGVPLTPHDEDRAIGSVLGTFTLRYPVGRFAPYIFTGLGVTFGGGEVENFEQTGFGNGQDYFEVYRGGDTTELLGQFGGGVEVRFTRHIGILGDFSWNVVDGPRNNFGMARAGVNFAF